jgi:hypothetical protein
VFSKLVEVLTEVPASWQKSAERLRKLADVGGLVISGLAEVKKIAD